MLDGNSEHVVFLQQLDGPFGTAWCRGDEERHLPFVAEAADVSHPVGDAAFQLDGGLAADLSSGWGLGTGC